MGGTVTSLYDILKARKTGLSSDLYTLLAAQSIGNGNYFRLDVSKLNEGVIK